MTINLPEVGVWEKKLICEGDSEAQTSSCKVSYRYKMYSVRNIVNNYVIYLYGDNKSYGGGYQFEM